MGLDLPALHFLLYSKAMGCDYSRTATIGRQGLSLGTHEVAQAFRDFDTPLTQPALDSIATGHDGFAEGLFGVLGASLVDSFDFSPYEGATVTHDMNLPLPDRHRGGYSLVVDGGSLEHVFNFAQAIANGMALVRPGGHYIGQNPCNNYLGHGFYQFSPELFFRVFCPENGFHIEAMFLVEYGRRVRWYAVRDPKEAGARGALINHNPTMMFVLARRVRQSPVLGQVPQQSDYVSRWTGDGTPSEGPAITRRQKLARMVFGSRRQAVLRRLPRFVKRLLIPRYNPRYFVRMSFSEICTDAKSRTPH